MHANDYHLLGINTRSTIIICLTDNYYLSRNRRTRRTLYTLRHFVDGFRGYKILAYVNQTENNGTQTD